MNTAEQSAHDYHERVKSKIHQDRMQLCNPAQRYLEGLNTLPPSPTLAVELLALFRRPDPDVDAVVELIRHEPSLTAQILHRCNSAFFAGDAPTADIFEGVTRLGFYEVYCFVVTLFGAKAKAMPGAEKGVNVDELWCHSVAAAVGSSVVADRVGLDRAEAFTAGLLHDIGKLVLASAEGERYAVVVQKAKANGELLVPLERNSFMIDHADLGGELMRRWKLPSNISAAVGYHHEVQAPTPFHTITAAVQVGDMLGHLYFEEELVQTDMMTKPERAIQLLRLGPDTMTQFLDETRLAMEKVKGLLEA